MQTTAKLFHLHFFEDALFREMFKTICLLLSSSCQSLGKTANKLPALWSVAAIWGVPYNTLNLAHTSTQTQILPRFAMRVQIR